MRRLSIAFGMMIFTFPLISVFAIAQTSPEIGVWKLNLAKSKFYNSQPPKNETRIVAGGMGEVYRAHDGRLNRDVALKVLPEVFAANPDRMARFEREARVLGALNHQ